MLDIIIPCYNDVDHLAITLASILEQREQNRIQIIIVNDGSNCDYSSVINYYSKYLPITFYKLEKNVGPGEARQYGVDHSCSPYIMFIDCGDVFTKYSHLTMVIDEITNNIQNDLFYWWGFIQETEFSLNTVLTGNQNYFFHGKVYCRKLLEEKQIRMWEEFSYCNEDTAFNNLIEFTYPDKIIYYDEPLIIQLYYPGSMTCKDKWNYEFYKSQQAVNLIIEKLINHFKDEDPEKRDDDIRFCSAKIMIYNYLDYLGASLVAPQYKDHVFQWSVYWYHNMYKQYKPDPCILTKIYYPSVQDWIQRFIIINNTANIGCLAGSPLIAFDFETYCEKCAQTPNNIDTIQKISYNDNTIEE